MINRTAAVAALMFPAMVEVFFLNSIGLTLLSASVMLITSIVNTLFGAIAGWILDSLGTIVCLCGSIIIILLLMDGPLQLIQGAVYLLLFGTLFVSCQWAALKLWT